MNVLAFFAHPDDETMLAGGLLALLAKNGFATIFLIATRGEGGECGEPPLCSQNELGKYRENELRQAVTALGGRELILWDYIDPLVGENQKLFSFSEDILTLSNHLNHIIKQKDIDILITHGSNGEYGHPAHQTVYKTAKKTMELFKNDVYWYTVQATYPQERKPYLSNKNDLADWVVDTSPVLKEKLAAAMAHKTQHALFLRRKTQEEGRVVALEEVLFPEESYLLVNKFRDDPLRSLIQKLGLLLYVKETN